MVETICNKGITREISFSDLTIEADTKTIGTTTVTIKYKTLSTSFEINVTAKEIASATFIEPSDVIFYKGDLKMFVIERIEIIADSVEDDAAGVECPFLFVKKQFQLEEKMFLIF